MISLQDHLSVGDFVVCDSIEREKTQKHKKLITAFQLIQMSDLERLNAIVKCLREVKSMDIDALLVYLNDISEA